jgi:hypothetical protein
MTPYVTGRRKVARGDDRRYDEVCADHARAALEAFVARCANQTEASDILGCNQGTLSRSLKAENQPSLRILIALARVTRRSLDRILGLDLDASVHEATSAPPPLTPSPPPVGRDALMHLFS